MISGLAASFPPGAGGLSADEVSLLLGAIDQERMRQGLIGSRGHSSDSTIRSGNVQWLGIDEIGAGIFSHLFTLAQVANRERGWNFTFVGPAPFLQATSYSGDAQEHYDWHMDWGRGALHRRKVTAVVHLSSPADFDGGSLQLALGSTPLEAVQEPGTVTVFPSFLLHRVTPVTRGRRLGAVSWMLGTPFS